ncbi:unnamed protein product [marine sediment metagenome]|uniref:Uncharacterized protein n=1 Tax=marine sediment metagenome TaxID=412755 RepID=X0YWS5_9ZZZZ
MISHTQDESNPTKEIGKFVAINNQKVYNYYLNNNLRHTAGLAYQAHPVSQDYY